MFETLVPKPMMLHYISLLLKHRRLVLSGPSGTGKTHLAQRLAHYLMQRNRADSLEGESLLGRSSAVSFNMHRQSHKVTCFYHRPSLFFMYTFLCFSHRLKSYVHFSVTQELQLYLSNLANQIDRESGGELPLVIIIDDISDSAAITELVNGALTCKYHKWWVGDCSLLTTDRI